MEQRGRLSRRGAPVRRARDRAGHGPGVERAPHPSGSGGATCACGGTRAVASRSRASRATPRTWSAAAGDAGALLRAGGGVQLGGAPGERWLRTRYAAPYLRDELLDRGVMAETLETATAWSNLPPSTARWRIALRDALGEQAMVMCHVSHLYPSGASLYFTFLARQADDALGSVAAGQDGRVGGDRRRARDDHPPPRRRPRPRTLDACRGGRAGARLLRAAKARLDPAGIMNPGQAAAAGLSPPQPGGLSTDWPSTAV